MNPLTGRRIRVGGPTYQKLLRRGVAIKSLRRTYRKRPSRKLSLKQQPVFTKAEIRRRVALGRGPPLDLEKLLVRTKEPARRRKLKKQIKRRGEGRGSRTRGWGAAHPRQGPQRRQLHKACGDACFLLPRDSSGKLVLKFPICPKCFEGDCSCKVSCAGVTSAKVRAAQWKYPHVLMAASRIGGQLNC